MTDTVERILHDHRGGKLRIVGARPLDTREELSIAYTPGVAKVCEAIAKDPSLAREYTWASRLVAVVTDGTSVLGLGDIGPRAAMPVMEGKAALFKRFGGLDAVPICLDTTDPDEIVDTVTRLAPSFGGVNLEDISAPRCFDIEARLEAALDIPVMHDDQHGTAVVVLAALRNALRLTGRAIDGVRIVVIGSGAAGVAVSRILLSAGAGDVTVVDSTGIIHSGRDDLNPVKRELAAVTNRAGLTGDVTTALHDADVMIGLSGARLDGTALAGMAPGAVVFALSNPDPEVGPRDARQHAAVYATGRSDMPNQINNVLAFPGIFAGAMDAGATNITAAMKLAAADAIAAVVGDDLAPDHVVPSPLDGRVAPQVTRAVRDAARTDARSGAAPH